MRLLVTTQIIDASDSNLGFFHEWIFRLAAKVDSLDVVCLRKGEYTLPVNVRVHSLGKENGPVCSLTYAWRFFKIVRQLHGMYDSVFVHMNPEYAILAGWYWRLTGKKVALWYLHKAVNMRLWLAEKFVNKIFTASKESCRLHSQKIDIVGHGIPVELFKNVASAPSSTTCMTDGRITPRKQLEVLINAVGQLKDFHFDIYGEGVVPGDREYRAKLERLIKDLQFTNIHFQGPINYADLPGVLAKHSLYLHASATGSVDKTVLQALAAGRIVVSSSEVFRTPEYNSLVHSFPKGNASELAKTIEKIRQSDILNNIPNRRAMDFVRVNHNLDTLLDKIVTYFLQK